MNKLLGIPTAFMLLYCTVLISCRKEQAIEVIPAFAYTIVSKSSAVPVDVAFTNTTSGATSFRWTFEGGEPAVSTKKDPGIIRFNAAGTHKVILEAWNEDVRRTKEISINLDSVVIVAFDTTVLVNHFSPLTLRITNRTIGASTFEWTFEGGVPATFNGANPPDVTFTAPGEHSITLKAGNSSGSFSLTKKIVVGPALSAAFSIEPSFQDEDYQAPLTATLANTTVGANSWQWTATGGTISAPTSEKPTIHFSAPGSYTVTLVAGNGKSTQTVSRTIAVQPNTNLRTHTDVKFGIASAHSNPGTFYSTHLRKSFTAGDNLDTAGQWIDIVFFGLNQNFSYNKFITPDSAQAYTLPTIPGAMPTVFVNSQELCGCGLSFSAADFNSMVTDAPLQNLTISQTSGGTHQFSNALTNRVVLFRTADGRKGAIKIKQFVQAAAGSYIIADIKVQKND